MTRFSPCFSKTVGTLIKHQIIFYFLCRHLWGNDSASYHQENRKSLSPAIVFSLPSSVQWSAAVSPFLSFVQAPYIFSLSLLPFPATQYRRMVTEGQIYSNERRSSLVVRTLAYHAAGPGSIPGLGGENYWCTNLALYIRDCEYLCLLDETLKAFGPFYLEKCNLSWTPHSSLEKDNSLNHSCVSPKMGCLEYTN